MQRLIFLFFIGLIPASILHAQIAGDSNFESGRLDSFYLAQNHYTLAPVAQLYARITGVKDSSTRFRIFDVDGYRMRIDHRMVYRYGSDSTWFFFDNAAKSGGQAYYHFWNDRAFREDTIFVAYWFPYTYTQLQGYLSKISTEPTVTNFGVRGNSIEGRNLYGFSITDPSVPDSCKLQVVITGRQHPIEFTQTYIIEGMVDYLVYSADSTANRLRQEYIFHVYPMLNPDGVYNGIGQNAQGSGLNRDWAPGTTPNGTVEIDIARTAIWQDCSGHADFAIDLHGNPGHRGMCYWWGQTSGPDSVHTERAARYVQSVHDWDGLLHPAPNMIQDYIQGDTYGGTAFTAGNWHLNTLGAVSFTFEPSSTPPATVARLKQIGESLARGFSVFSPSVECDSVSTSLQPENSMFGYSVYPNPSNGLIYLRGRKALASDLRFRIYSVLGKKLSEWELEILEGTFQVPIDLKRIGVNEKIVLLEVQAGEITFREVIIITP
jgi:hypothetical protein